MGRLLLWLALPAAALVLLLASVSQFSIPEYTLRLPVDDTGTGVKATWSAPDDADVGILLLTGAEGSPPGTRMLVADLFENGAAVLQLPLSSGTLGAQVQAGASAVAERSDGMLPATIVAFGTASEEALAYAASHPVARVVLVDPESVPERFQSLEETTSVALLAVAPEDHGDAYRTFYEFLSGDDTVLLPSASGNGRIDSEIHLAADGKTLLMLIPDLPSKTGLTVPIFRDTVLRWALPDSGASIQNPKTERTLLPVYAALTLAAGALVPLVVPRLMQTRRPRVVPAFAAFLIPAVFGVIAHWIWNRPILTWVQVAAGLAAGAVAFAAAQLLRTRTSGPLIHLRSLLVLAAYTVAALFVWLSGPRTLVLALSILGGAGCAWGYARVAGHLVRSEGILHATGTVLLILMM